MSQKLSFVDAFTLSIISTIKSQKIKVEKRQVINADLIPRIHEEIAQRHFENRKIEPVPNIQFKPLPQAHPKIQSQQTAIKPRPVITPLIPKKPMMTMPITESQSQPEPNPQYGKIDFLLKDKTVSTIECPGPNQNILVFRAGQRQFTKISLTPEEIKQILNNIAQEARVPLIEGIFKAAVDSFIISAVVSETIGSRFVIKKQTPYAILENQ